MSNIVELGEEVKVLPLEVFLIVSQKNNRPCIEIRKATTDVELIKLLVGCAYHNVPMVVQPKFTNSMKSLGALVDKGILYYDKEQDRYYFTL